MRTQFAIRCEWVMLLLALVAAFGCSQKPVFQVNYFLPQGTATYPDQQVHVSATDARSSTQVATPAAAAEMGEFPELFSLVVLRGKDVGDLVGAYKVVELMQALCRHRLQASAVPVVDSPAAAATRFEVLLKDFQLDYADRKWIAAMSYEAVVHRPDGTTRRQQVNGSAERVKIWRSADAEKVVSELVSDMINKLDLDTLLGN